MLAITATADSPAGPTMTVGPPDAGLWPAGGHLRVSPTRAVIGRRRTRRPANGFRLALPRARSIRGILSRWLARC